MRWISPCSAVFIKNNRKILLTFRSCISSILTCISKSSGKKVSRICMAYRNDCFRSQKSLSGSYIFHPMAKFSVSKTSAYCKILINSVYFHLPGSIMCNLHSPEYMVTSVFYSKKREIMIYRQRNCLSESFTAYRFFCPGYIQLKFFKALGEKTSLLTPSALQTMDHDLSCFIT